MDTKQRQRAAVVRSAAADRFDQIRGNNQLSDRGRAAQMDAVHRAAAAEMRALKEAETTTLQARRAHLETSVFGTPSTNSSDIIAYRDAADRAAQIKKPDEAVEAVHRAVANRDPQMATAIARRAVDANWGDAFTAWLDYNPQHNDAIQELGDIDDHLSRGTLSLAFKAPEQPREIKKLLPAQLAEIRADSSASSHTAVQAERERFANAVVA